MLLVLTSQTLKDLADGEKPSSEVVCDAIWSICDQIRANPNTDMEALTDPHVLEVALLLSVLSNEVTEAVGNLILSILTTPKICCCFFKYFDQNTFTESKVSQKYKRRPEVESPISLLALISNKNTTYTSGIIALVSTVGKEVCSKITNSPSIDMFCLTRNLLEYSLFTVWCILCHQKLGERLHELHLGWDQDLKPLPSYALCVILNHPNLIFAAHSLNLKGAKFFLDKYTPPQKAAFDTSSKNPCKLVTEILTQGPLFVFSGFPILPYLIVIGTREVLRLSQQNVLKLYQSHNSSCKTRSLLAAQCDLAILTAKNLLWASGKDAEALGVLDKLTKLNELPPMAKPNYFSASADFCTVLKQEKPEADLGILLLLFDLDHLELLAESIIYNLEAILNVIEHELLVEDDEQIQVLKVEKILGTIIAAMTTLTAFGTQWQLACVGIDVAANTAKKLIKTCADAGLRTMVWVTLFNFANDVCYADISLVPAVIQLLDLVSLEDLISDELELVKSALELFFFTFDDGSKQYNNVSKLIPWNVNSGNTLVSVPRIKFAFLYEDGSKPQKREKKR